MSYVTVPNTFTSATTLFASAMNENFTAITNSLSDGSKSLFITDLTCTSMTVSGNVTTPAATIETTLSVSGTNTNSSLTVTDLKASKFGLGAPEYLIPIAGSITPSKSYIKSFRDITEIVSTNFSSGSLLIIQKHEGVDQITVTPSSTLILGDTRTLDNIADKLILQYIDSKWYELQFQGNA